MKKFLLFVVLFGISAVTFSQDFNVDDYENKWLSRRGDFDEVQIWGPLHEDLRVPVYDPWGKVVGHYTKHIRYGIFVRREWESVREDRVGYCWTTIQGVSFWQWRRREGYWYKWHWSLPYIKEY